MDLHVGMLALGKEQIKSIQTTELVFFGAVERYWVKKNDNRIIR